MPEMRQFPATPQAVNQDLLLPDRFPPLPDSIRKRFGDDAAEFDAQLGQFWTRTRRVLSDTYFGLAAPVNAVKQDARNIRKEYVTAIGTMTASFQEQINVLVSDTEAVATRVTTLEASVETTDATILARITTEETTRASADTALATRTTTVEASINTPTTGILARITTEETARATADTALSTRTTTVEAAINTPTTGILARITTEETARATADTALSTRTTTVEAAINTPTTGILARITTEETARATADTALSTRTTTLESTINTPTTGVLALITTEETTRASADSALSTRTTTVESAINTATTGILARITTVEATKVDAAGASAAASSVLTAALTGPSGSIFASVDFERAARVTADGFMSGKLTLTATAGNIVTGMNITSSTGPGTNISDFTVFAGNFRIYSNTFGTGGTAIAPFQVIGGQVRVQNLTIVSSDVSGLGALATQNSLAYGAITGTKPPTNADVTLTALQGELSLAGGGLVLASSGAKVRGGMTGYNSGPAGFWLGDVGGTSKLAIGNPAGDKLLWTGSALEVTGAITGSTISGSTLNAGSGIGKVVLDSSGALFGDIAAVSARVATTSASGGFNYDGFVLSYAGVMKASLGYAPSLNRQELNMVDQNTSAIINLNTILTQNVKALSTANPRNNTAPLLSSGGCFISAALDVNGPIGFLNELRGIGPAYVNGGNPTFPGYGFQGNFGTGVYADEVYKVKIAAAGAQIVRFVNSGGNRYTIIETGVIFRFGNNRVNTGGTINGYVLAEDGSGSTIKLATLA